MARPLTRAQREWLSLVRCGQHFNGPGGGPWTGLQPEDDMRTVRSLEKRGLLELYEYRCGKLGDFKLAAYEVLPVWRVRRCDR